MRPLNNVGMHYIQREYLDFSLVILSIRLSDKIEKKKQNMTQGNAGIKRC